MPALDGDNWKEIGRITQIPTSICQKSANRHNKGQSADNKENNKQEKVCIFTSMTSSNGKKKDDSFKNNFKSITGIMF